MVTMVVSSEVRSRISTPPLVIVSCLLLKNALTSKLETCTQPTGFMPKQRCGLSLSCLAPVSSEALESPKRKS